MSDGALHTYLAAGNLMCFSDGVGETFKDDVLVSTLYTQLAASKKHSMVTEFETWRETCLRAMTAFGWIFTQREAQSDPSGTQEIFDLFSLIELYIGAVAIPLQRQIKQMPSAVSSVVIDEVNSLSVVTLQVSFIQAEPEMTSLWVQIKTRQAVCDNPFTQRFATDQIVGTVKRVCFSAELLDRHYALFREKLIAALGDKRQTLITRIEESVS